MWLLEDDDDLDTGEERPINAPQLTIETSECPESNLGAPGELLKPGSPQCPGPTYLLRVVVSPHHSTHN